MDINALVYTYVRYIYRVMYSRYITVCECLQLRSSNGVRVGMMLYVGGADSLLRVWPLDFEDFLVEARHEGPISCLAMTSSHVLGANQARYIHFASIDPAFAAFIFIYSKFFRIHSPVFFNFHLSTYYVRVHLCLLILLYMLTCLSTYLCAHFMQIVMYL